VDSRQATVDPERLALGAAAWTLRASRRLAWAQRGVSVLRRLLRRSRSPGWIGWLPPPLTGWTRTRDVPALPPESFRAWWARTRGSDD
jgi:L-lactate dehydrogenase complex protein LldF